jgi:hypothetical protein
MIIHRLTVDGKDYFLPSPVDELKASILAAIQTGGGYVTVPPLRGGPGLDILFSPGMPVVWAQIEVADSEPVSVPVDNSFDADGL